MTQKWYATLRHPKMYPHTKFGIPTSKNIGDMDRTRKRDGRTDGRTDGLTDSAITICLPKFLWGHKKWISPGPWLYLRGRVSVSSHSLILPEGSGMSVSWHSLILPEGSGMSVSWHSLICMQVVLLFYEV